MAEKTRVMAPEAANIETTAACEAPAGWMTGNRPLPKAMAKTSAAQPNRGPA
ncbi:hypothetical protein LRS10_00805 [Phenylobacterium sp. J426]|uniref:hypothetical protein n=1 Tax=Phenylobacterium sp. J426 TaxID=2898439 RepID=UPI002150D2D4|nr:hypothetical protein [Phenylobacterium sp. J426]MCR5872859.1 hypothetical protein [Phenylobacterium sp. J426]